MRVRRVTQYCPIEGSSYTTVYVKKCFRWKIKHRYRMLLTRVQTIGFKESHLGLPSVPKEYGDFIGLYYIFKREI